MCEEECAPELFVYFALKKKKRGGGGGGGQACLLIRRWRLTASLGKFISFRQMRVLENFDYYFHFFSLKFFQFNLLNIAKIMSD